MGVSTCEPLVPGYLPAWRKGQSPSERLDYDHIDPGKQEYMYALQASNVIKFLLKELVIIDLR